MTTYHPRRESPASGLSGPPHFELMEARKRDLAAEQSLEAIDWRVQI